MPLPGVNINLLNGQLGQAESQPDGLGGLVYSGVAVPDKVGLVDPKLIFSIQDAIDLGIDQAYDQANNTKVYRHIEQFYSQASTGTPLWFVLYSPDTLMENAANPNFGPVKTLLDAAQGQIRVLALGRSPGESYNPSYIGLDPDVYSAMNNLQELGERYASEFKPFRAVLDGRGFDEDAPGLRDLTQGSDNRVSILLSTSDKGSTNASIGLALGRLSSIPPQRNMGRVRDGDLSIQEAFITNGISSIESQGGALDFMHDKGYINLRRIQGRDGYYFTDDLTATSANDDYSSLAHGRVIDKASTLIHNYYVDFILDDLDTDDDGFIDPSQAQIWQEGVRNTLQVALVNTGNASGIYVFVDPRQNILQTKSIAIDIKIRLKGYAGLIIINLGLNNPTLNNA